VKRCIEPLGSFGIKMLKKILNECSAKPENKLNGKNQIIYSAYGIVTGVCGCTSQDSILYTKQDNAYSISAYNSEGVLTLELICSHDQLSKEIKRIFDAGTRKEVGELKLSNKKIRSFVDVMHKEDAPI
jgi:hypothetical protein